MPGKERSAIFSSDHIPTSGRESDEVARSWPQMMALLLQVLQQLQKATADGSVKLTRQQRAQLHTEARDAQKIYDYQAQTTRQWYQARAQDYQREAKAAAARATAGASPQEQAQSAAYLKGLRASIEHTIHDTTLTPEQRGQVVQTLDAVDHDSSKPLPRNMFEQVEDAGAARARYAAAGSEYRVAQHRQQLTTTEAAPSGGAEASQWQRESARRFGELGNRIARLEAAIEELVPRHDATATAGSNGQAKPRVTQQADQQHSAAQAHFAQAHTQAEPGTTAHADAEQSEMTHPDQEHPAPEQPAPEADNAEQRAAWIAQMEAEA
ncbi:hypothetical protein OHB26_21035 [Nocardia sp. NBC_01503]|uniref:hypothetical protein n=1 Tax=Nocardia sp. NBC_01503 TaxID=2975997 RepID=UPI002E7AD01B|nr:hypothetical protein [Nocardia sp. NBC_01503]WTL29485.1 hypothetical protein OHB26_21035 [Nocardia sp. NBC_01503]